MRQWCLCSAWAPCMCSKTGIAATGILVLEQTSVGGQPTQEDCKSQSLLLWFVTVVLQLSSMHLTNNKLEGTLPETWNKLTSVSPIIMLTFMCTLYCPCLPNWSLRRSSSNIKMHNWHVAAPVDPTLGDCLACQWVAALCCNNTHSASFFGQWMIPDVWWWGSGAFVVREHLACVAKQFMPQLVPLGLSRNQMVGSLPRKFVGLNVFDCHNCFAAVHNVPEW